MGTPDVAMFTLRQGDTRPVLEVALLDADGEAHDLTGSTDWKLHIRVSSSVTLTRTMTVQDADGGLLRYTWQTADWNAGALPDVAAGEIAELPMEYEVVSAAGRLTFPSEGHDVLQIRGDLA
jgi:hypothetical protein